MVLVFRLWTGNNKQQCKCTGRNRGASQGLASLGIAGLTKYLRRILLVDTLSTTYIITLPDYDHIVFYSVTDGSNTQVTIITIEIQWIHHSYMQSLHQILIVYRSKPVLSYNRSHRVPFDTLRPKRLSDSTLSEGPC